MTRTILGAINCEDARCSQASTCGSFGSKVKFLMPKTKMGEARLHWGQMDMSKPERLLVKDDQLSHLNVERNLTFGKAP